MNKKNQNNYESPDIGKLQEVVIDFRTKIYSLENPVILTPLSGHIDPLLF